MTAPEISARACGRDGCGNTFTPKRSDARYCCDACRNAANRARSRSDPIRSDNRPDRVAAATATRSPVLPAWEPPSEGRGAWQVSEACAHCGEQLHTTGRATIRVCVLNCKGRVVPQGVTAPYQRGGELVRQVRSQRERDLEAIALAERKGIMLGQLGQIGDDERLHPESLPVVEWFAAEVRAATSAERLTELADLLPDSGIRRRYRWKGEPAAIEAPDYDDEVQGDDADYDEPEYVQNESASQVVKPPLPDYTAELAVREWKFQPHGFGICGLIHMKPHGWDTGPQECINRATHLIAGGAVCDSCFHALNYPMGGR